MKEKIGFSRCTVVEKDAGAEKMWRARSATRFSRGTHLEKTDIGISKLNCEALKEKRGYLFSARNVRNDIIILHFHSEPKLGE